MIKKRILTDQELAIMNIVWRLEEATVRDVYEALLRERKIAYTTVMTMMKILESKGHLSKKALGRAYLYRPTRPKNLVVRELVTDFLDRVFNGSAEPLLLHLARDRRLSEKDLKKLHKILEDDS